MVTTQYPAVNPDGTCSRCGKVTLPDPRQVTSGDGTVDCVPCDCPQGLYRGSEPVEDDDDD